MTDLREDYRGYVDETELYAGRGYAPLDHRCRQLFSHVGVLEGKTMLEIGGGEGLFSLWALANGARKVVVLEPEAEGSTIGAGQKLEGHRRTLGIAEEWLVLQRQTLQDYEANGQVFDLILSYSSINHLKESACVLLRESENAWQRYMEIFKKVNTMLKEGGHLIISDSGHHSLWGLLGLRSPFAPTIDWRKHQDPELWRRLLNQAGFEFRAIEWHRFYPLRMLGVGWLTRFVAWVTTNQFILTMQKP